jgi:hypothetical protein
VVFELFKPSRPRPVFILLFIYFFLSLYVPHCFFLANRQIISVRSNTLQYIRGMATGDRSEALMSEIQTLLRKNDAASRKKATALSRELTATLEVPQETAAQISFMVCGTTSYYDDHVLISTGISRFRFYVRGWLSTSNCSSSLPIMRLLSRLKISPQRLAERNCLLVISRISPTELALTDTTLIYSADPENPISDRICRRGW